MNHTLKRIEKLSDIKQYERIDDTNPKNNRKRWTKDCPLVLVTKDGRIFTSNKWHYLAHNDELVYDKKLNLWLVGENFYDNGKSGIKDVYVVVKTPVANTGTSGWLHHE